MKKLHILTTTFAFFSILAFIFRNDSKGFVDMITPITFMVIAVVNKAKVNTK